LLGLMRRKVDRLRGDLPKKYDPKEPLTRPTPYLAYTTLGDEAGLGLHFFGAVTWMVQTVSLAASLVLIVGLLTATLMTVEMLSARPDTTSLLGMLRLSPSKHPGNFAWLMDWLTFYPVMVLNWFATLQGSTKFFHNLGDLGAAMATSAVWVPWNLVIVVGWILVFLMPAMLAVIGVAYVISMALRGSGLVFGGERFTWTMANNITANRRPGPNTKLKTFNIAPEAWKNGKMAHCYFYESEPVIVDLATRIAQWRDFQADPALRPGPMVAFASRWLLVMFSVLCMFAYAVQMAEMDVRKRAAVATTAEQPAAAAPSAASQPTTAPAPQQPLPAASDPPPAKPTDTPPAAGTPSR